MLIYRIILLIISPFVVIKMLIALLRGRETGRGLMQRLGYGKHPKNSDLLIWIHGASLGELTAARPLIQALLSRSADLQILTTSNTYTARDMVAGWNHPRIIARLAPFDTPRIVARFLRKYAPVAAITLENELWPIRSLHCAKSSIPVMVIGGRMSRKSALIWARFPEITHRVMANINSLAPLDDANGARFVKLGLPADHLRAPVNLKASVILADPDPDELERLSPLFRRATTILAASTHEGEEELILSAFKTINADNPKARLILAPRHPERGDEIADLIDAQGLTCTRRTEGGEININNAVYLADTVGEMPIWYSLASITIVGGSFVQKGGHTPFEPVQYESIILHGPDISNHQDAYAALTEIQAAYMADSAEMLAQFLNVLLNTDQQSIITDRATLALNALRPETADIDGLVTQIFSLKAQ